MEYMYNFCCGIQTSFLAKRINVFIGARFSNLNVVSLYIKSELPSESNRDE